MGMSKVETVNMALDHLGKDRIASLTENSTAARKANEIFERCTRSVLQAAPWTFARKIANLANLTNDWEQRWAYKYDVPNDCMKFVRVVPEIDLPNTDPVPHQLLGGAVYTVKNPAAAEYVFETYDTQSMPQYFLDTLATYLAREMAMPLVRKMSYREMMQKEYAAQLAFASMTDAGQEPQSYAHEDNAYLDARGAPLDGGNVASYDGSSFWDS